MLDEIKAAIRWMIQHGVEPSHILVDEKTRWTLIALDSHGPQYADHPPIFDVVNETAWGIPVHAILADGQGWRVVKDSSAWN